jgi:lysophospholipid acyltransferase (LPLAT)-like uncharacterized protein
MFRRWILPNLVWLVYRLWTWTWRVRFVEPASLGKLIKSGEKLIFAHWHGDELSIVQAVPLYKIATMTSTSKDGQLMDAVLRKFGAATSRGSATRGGVGALKGLIRLVGQGYRASMAVDGPKGPLHKVKPGVFELSRLAKAHIVPVGVASSRAIVFHKSWNKARLPKPFAKVIVQFGEPWAPLNKGIDLEKLALRLESEISDAAHQAAKHFAQAEGRC